MSYKSECQEKYLPVGSVPTLFLSRHSAQPFERRSFFLPVVPLHCCDGAIRFLKQTSPNGLSALIGGNSWSYLRLVAYDFLWLSEGA